MTDKEAIEKAKAVLYEATEYDDSVCYVTSEDEEWIQMAIEALENQKTYGDKVTTEEIASIRTGKWERKEEQFFGDNYYVCSNCGESYDIGGANINDFKYCPNCGAKM